MKLRAYGRDYEVRLRSSKYLSNDNTSIMLECWDEDYKYWQSFCVLSKNISSFPYGVCAIDTNNCPFAEDFIKENNLGFSTGWTVRSGFHDYPVYNMDMSKFTPMEQEDK